MRPAALIIWITLSLAIVSCAQTDYSSILVARVVDGDTLRLRNGESLRLIGMDTPEMYESDKLYRDARESGEDVHAIMAQGRRAYEFTRSLAEDKVVCVEFDQQRYDDYGRLLGYVFLADGTFLNAKIVEAGFARPLAIEPNTTYAGYIEHLYRQAKAEKRGLWK